MATKKKVVTKPSTKVAQAIAKTIAPSRESFMSRFGTLEDLMPSAVFQQLADQQVNPEMIRSAVAQIGGYDKGMGATGSWRTGAGLRDRDLMVSALERQRREAATQWTDAQRQLFTDWYGKQMQGYMDSPNPSNYVLNRFGIQTPQGTEEITPIKGQPAQYVGAPDLRSMFRIGGYARPTKMYGDVVKPGTVPGSTPLSAAVGNLPAVNKGTDWYDAWNKMKSGTYGTGSSVIGAGRQPQMPGTFSPVRPTNNSGYLTY